ncbi:MAG: hypothetical protein KDA69_12195 [Planctomycetaceae bacterium]|nr:hypothetical protein [Planctomycetaceae bacterium]MCA9045078.1 hypothetical protein [Planctomycetaceae bacterium]
MLKQCTIMILAFVAIAALSVRELSAQGIHRGTWNSRRSASAIQEQAHARRSAIAQRAQERRAAFNSPEARERRRQFWQSFAQGMGSDSSDFSSTNYDWGSSDYGSGSDYGLSPSFLQQMNNYHSPYNYSGY